MTLREVRGGGVTGEQMLDAMIQRAIEMKGYTLAAATDRAWMWLAAESGVTVRWEGMTFEQRWTAEAVLERQAILMRPAKKKLKRQAFIATAFPRRPPETEQERRANWEFWKQMPQDVWDALEGTREGQQVTLRMELAQVG